MHRCGPALLLTFSLVLVAALTGCLGKNSANPGNSGIQSVTLSPGTSISLDVGGTEVFSATGKNAVGGTVLGGIQFLVASGSPNSASPLSVASNGAACAGTWDTTATLCSPGTPGIAIVTAVISGVSSPPTTVYVHYHIDNIQISQAESIAPQFDCFSQGQTWQFQGVAHDSNKNDITNTVGPMIWEFSNSGVLSPDTTGTSLLPNQVEVTAKSPGITRIFANVGATTSTPYTFTTCLVQYIRLQINGQGQSGNSIAVSNGGGVTVTATAVDSLNNIITNPPLTWSTTNSEVAAFSSTSSTSISNTATARGNLGGTTLTASCTPPTCNVGVQPGLPVFASDGKLPNGENGYAAISVSVSSTSIPPTYTAWAATTGCDNLPGCSSAMFSVAPGVTPIGAIVGLPRTPNSMMFNHLSSSRVYLGSDQGLMYSDVSASSPSVNVVSNASNPCNVTLCGRVLTISYDGRFVVISDTVSKGHVYIYDGGTTSTGTNDLTLSNAGEVATAAAFSPDEYKLFLLTDQGNMYVYSTVDALKPVAITPGATDVKFAADGSFAYVANSPSGNISAYSTCSVPTAASVKIASAPASTTPINIFPSPVLPLPTEVMGTPPIFYDTQTVLALEPPNVEFFSAEYTQDPVIYKDPVQTTCNVPLVKSFSSVGIANLGQGAFDPIYSELAGNGTQMVIVARKLPAVLLFDVANKTTTSIPLQGNPDPLSASASSDGSQVYVAACDQYVPNSNPPVCAAGSVHIVNTISQGDFQQVPYVNINQNNNPNMCSGQGAGAPLCLPNLIAIKPQ
jgi:hypothetical protein